MKKITGIHFNWFFSLADNCPGYDKYAVGVDGVASIEYCPDYPYAPCRYVIFFEDGKEEWITNVNRVFLEQEPLSSIQPPSDNVTFELPF